MSLLRRWLRHRRSDADDSPPPTPPVGLPPGRPPEQAFLLGNARRTTFRIRNLSSEGTGHGAGFAVGRRLVVTNRHVVEEADPLEVSTCDGEHLPVRVAAVARDHDLALLTTSRTLDRWVAFAHHLPGNGDPVRVVGYPLGEEFTAERGRFVDQVDGSARYASAEVLRIRAVVMPGYSGGPILNADGQVIGVVYASEWPARCALAIPAQTVMGWLERAPLTGPPPSAES